MRAASGGGHEVALLVGGFAESALLQARLRSFLAHRDVELFIPERPSIAVVTGAVHFAYDPSVFSGLRAPYTYGVEIYAPFRPGVDPVHLRTRDTLCRERFHTLVVRGSPVQVGTRLPAQTFWAIWDDQKVITFAIFRTTRADAQYTFESGMTKIGTVTVDVSSGMHLPPEQRTAEISLILDAHEIRVVGQNPTTGVEKSEKIDWEPTW
jgi:hypothetical protein